MDRSKRKVYINILVAILLGIAIKLFLKPADSLTPEGVSALAVCIPTIFLWITVDTTWPSLIALSLITLTGVYESASEVSSVSIGNSAVLFSLICMMLSNILADSGIVDRCTNFFLSRKIISGKPYRFLFMYFFSLMILDNFIESLALIMISCQFIKKLMDDMGIKKHSNCCNALYLGTLWICNTVGACCPVGKVLPMLLIQLLPFDVSIFKWWALGLPFQFLFLGLLMFVLKFFIKPFERDGLVIGEYEYVHTRISTKELLTTITLVTVILMWILPDVLPKGALPGVMSVFKMLGNYGPAALGIAFLCIITADKEPVADIRAAAKKIPVSLFVFISAVFMVANTVSSPKTGIRNYLAEIIEPHLHSTSYLLILAIVLLLTLVMTNMTSDIATAMLFSQIALTVFVNNGYSTFVVVMLVGIVSSMSILTPNASVPTSIIYGTGNVRAKAVFPYALMLVLFSVIGVILLGYLLMKFV